VNALRDTQLAMARYLRDPDGQPPPAGIEPRRLQVYRELVYNNLAGFIDSAFPVLHSLYEPGAWRALVREFIRGHRCRSPYFLEISQEFLQFLMEDYRPGPGDPPFLCQLAHYEWVELALDVAAAELPPPQAVAAPLELVPRLSPLAWLLAYDYPVQRIGPAFRPAAPGAPTYLVVYRDRADRVRFMEVNAATARLLELVRDNTGDTVAALLDRLAGELGADAAPTRAFGGEQVLELLAAEVILPRGPGPG